MSNKLLKLVVKIVNKENKKEANNACLGLGYQPLMPDSVRKLRKHE